MGEKQWRIQGPAKPLISRPNWGQTFFGDPTPLPPPPPLLPPYLKAVWSIKYYATYGFGDDQEPIKFDGLLVITYVSRSQLVTWRQAFGYGEIRTTVNSVSAVWFKSIDIGREIYCLKFPSHITSRTTSSYTLSYVANNRWFYLYR